MMEAQKVTGTLTNLQTYKHLQVSKRDDGDAASLLNDDAQLW
jgi:hypothetical protein